MWHEMLQLIALVDQIFNMRIQGSIFCWRIPRILRQSRESLPLLSSVGPNFSSHDLVPFREADVSVARKHRIRLAWLFGRTASRDIYPCPYAAHRSLSGYHAAANCFVVCWNTSLISELEACGLSEFNEMCLVRHFSGHHYGYRNFIVCFRCRSSWHPQSEDCDCTTQSGLYCCRACGSFIIPGLRLSTVSPILSLIEPCMLVGSV